MLTLAAGSKTLAPTLVTACTSLPPEGAGLRLGRPGAASVAPTLNTGCTSLLLTGTELRLGRVNRGFTLLELLVVLAIMAMATAGVTLSLRDSADTALEREAQRLAALFESARAQSRASGVEVRWHTTPEGFRFEGLPAGSLPAHWLTAGITVRGNPSVQLGPEPVVGTQMIELVNSQQPLRVMRIATRGLRPFAVQAAEQP